MVRSLGIAAVVAGLAWTGLAGAQPLASPPSGAAASAERFLTVREEGKTPVRCKLLKTWQESSGATAFQVQAVESGEVMTLLQYGSSPSDVPGGARTMPTRIYHWNGDGKPPENAPVPPPGAAVIGTPTQPRPASIAAPSPRAQLFQGAPTGAPQVASPPAQLPAPTTVRESAMPPRIITKTQPSPSATSPTAVAPSLTARKPEKPETTTPRSDPAPATAGRADTAPRVTAQPSPTTTVPTAPQTHGTTGTPPAVPTTPTPVVSSHPGGCNCSSCNTAQSHLMPQAAGTVVSQAPCTGCGDSCCSCCESSCASCTPPTRQRWLGRLFKPKMDSCVACCPPACSECTTCAPAPAGSSGAPVMPPAAAGTPPAAKVAAVPAPTRDWRESWGKVEPWKATAQADPAGSDYAPAKRTAQAPVAINPPTEPDPLSNPELYHGMALKEKPAGSKAVETPAVATNVSPPNPRASGSIVPYPPHVESTPPGANSVVSAMPGVMSGPEVAKGPNPTRPAQGANVLPPTAPRGRAVELPANEGNAFWTPPPPTPPQTAEGPKYNAFSGNPPPPPGGAPTGPMGVMPRGGMPMGGMPMGGMPMGGMPTGGMPMGGMPMPMPPRPPMPPPVVDSGVPSGMANAFTLAGTRRPIPADFGPTPQEANGFGDAVPYVAAQGPNVPPRQPMLPPSPGMMGYLPPMPPMRGMPGMPMMPGMPGMPPMSGMSGMMPQAPAMTVNPLMAVPPRPVAASAAAPAVPSSVPQTLATLRDSQFPSEREVAADQLASLNWHAQPQVVVDLAKAARDDPAATVRAACVRALAHMKVNTTDVVAVVQELKNDRDARVRHEADEALGAFGVASAPRQDAAVRPASHQK